MGWDLGGAQYDPKALVQLRCHFAVGSLGLMPCFSCFVQENAHLGWVTTGTLELSPKATEKQTGFSLRHLMFV